MYRVSYWKEGKKYAMNVQADNDLEARCKVFARFFGKVRGFLIYNVERKS